MGKSMNQIVLCIALCLILLFVFTGCEDDTSEESLRKYPNLSSQLQQLIEANEQGNAEEFAQQRSSIILDDSNVLVIIDPEQGKVEKALDAVREYGGSIADSPNKRGSFGAYVPIDSLILLIDEKSIRYIRTPEKPVH